MTVIPNDGVIVVVNWEDYIIRVYQDSPEARHAIAEWRALDALYISDRLPEDDYRSIEEFMEERGHKRLNHIVEAT